MRGSNGGPRRFTAIVLKVSRRLDDAQVPATRRCFTDGRVRYITDTSPAHWGSGGPDWRGMGPADLEAGQRVSTRWRRKSGEWPERVASGQWSVNLREWSWRRQKSAKTKPIAWGANRWWTVTYGERGRNLGGKRSQFFGSGSEWWRVGRGEGTKRANCLSRVLQRRQILPLHSSLARRGREKRGERDRDQDQDQDQDRIHPPDLPLLQVLLQEDAALVQRRIGPRVSFVEEFD